MYNYTWELLRSIVYPSRPSIFLWSNTKEASRAPTRTHSRLAMVWLVFSAFATAATPVFAMLLPHNLNNYVSQWHIGTHDVGGILNRHILPEIKCIVMMYLLGFYNSRFLEKFPICLSYNRLQKLCVQKKLWNLIYTITWKSTSCIKTWWHHCGLFQCPRGTEFVGRSRMGWACRAT